METRFQTSFIPKKPLVSVNGMSSAPHRAPSFFMILAVLLFIISIGAAAGMYFWKAELQSSQAEYKTQLAQREKQFNPDLIEELKHQNVKIDLAKGLIQDHIAMSQIFDIIGRMTIESVRFISMDVTAGQNKSEGIKVNMRGYGTTLSAVAYQSDVLGQLEKYGLRKVVKNPILSDPALDSNGLVSFGFTATIDPASLSYEKSLTPAESTASTTEETTQ